MASEFSVGPRASLRSVGLWTHLRAQCACRSPKIVVILCVFQDFAAKTGEKFASKGDVFIRLSYNAGKATVKGLTTGMACSYAEHGITVNAVGPGLFESEMTAGTLFKSDAFLTSYGKTCPAGRPGQKGELNGAILFLSSDASGYVQGQLILVDGGFTLV